MYRVLRDPRRRCDMYEPLYEFPKEIAKNEPF